jgi:glycosyltransferase involved in cell wall biosynthesis
MKVLIISASHPFHASGVVGFDLYEGLKSLNNDVRLMTKATGRHENKDIIFVDSYFRHQFERVLRKFRRTFFKENGNPDYLFFERDLTKKKYSSKRLLKKVDFTPDAIIVLFMTRFVTFQNLHEMHHLSKAKIFIYPMDMEPFTGGCHYAWSCTGYTQSCGKCPALRSEKPTDWSARNLAFKLKYSSITPLVPLALNEQTFQQMASSRLFHRHKIHTGLYTLPDGKIFKRLDRAACRVHFALPDKKRILFFGAVSLTETRKGMALLQQALSIVSSELDDLKFDKNNLLLLIAGSEQHSLDLDPSFTARHTGFIKGYATLAMAYNAADFFISPSIEETGPTMVLQSIFCETPVISFHVGYSMDLLQDRLAKFVAPEKNAASLARCIVSAILTDDAEYQRCRADVAAIRESLAHGTVVKKINEILASECS